MSVIHEVQDSKNQYLIRTEDVELDLETTRNKKKRGRNAVE